MSNHVVLARQALRAAIRARRQANVPDHTPISIFDFSDQQFDLEVWFVDIRNLEGMYQHGSPGRILISSHRSPGRQAMTCAHELGHHIFEHGTHVDEYVGASSERGNQSTEEQLVDLFASFLLMPDAAVQTAFAHLEVDPASAQPEDFYLASQYLGTSYEALIQHMRWSLNQIGDSQCKDLLKQAPKRLKQSLSGLDKASEVVVAGPHWESRSIDLAVDDILVVPVSASVDSRFLSPAGSCERGTLYRASQQGLTQVEDSESDWAAHVRITRHQYSGRNIYRHMEDPDV